MKNMLRNLTKMLRDKKLERVLGSIEQLLTNLLGKHGLYWEEVLKKLLRKKLVVFRHDHVFSLDFLSAHSSGGYMPTLFCSKLGLMPHEVCSDIALQGRRMGRIEELISFLATPRGEGGRTEVFVFSNYGEKGVPCAIGFSIDGNELICCIKENNPETIWPPGTKFLTFPVVG